MSDTSQPVAPPPSAPPPQAPPAPPPQVDVPVNEKPVNQQTPIGEQAPRKPEGQDSNKSSHISRREALQQAFARAKEAQDEAAKAPPKKADAPSKVAEKTEKTSQPSEKQQRYREGGKFAKDPAKAAEPPAVQPVQGEQPQPGQEKQPTPVKPLDERAPYREAPGRFRDQAKAEWHATPESVRAGVYQMAKEFQGAYEKYKGSHDTMQELQPYQELVTKQGTSLRKAFDNYYSMEQKLHQDVVGGVDVIIQNMSRAYGWKGPHGGPLNVQDFAAHVLSQTPEQRQISQQQNHQTSAEMRIGQLHQTVDQLSQGISQLMYQQKFTATRSQVDQFAEAHPRFDELADLIKAELDLGFPLEQAYQRADRLRPSSTQAAQTRTQPAQTRKTSISGAPDGGNGKASATPRPSDGQRRSGETKHPTRREALAKAMRRVGNGV